MSHSSTFIKKISLALGVVGISTLVGIPAWAQTSTPNSASQEFQEIKMSKEGMVILCHMTPMNSRCEGSPYNASSSSKPSPSGTTAPTQNLPSESDVPSPRGQTPGGTMSPGMMRGESPSGSGGTMTPPSNTTAPTENLPSESPVPSPMTR